MQKKKITTSSIYNWFLGFSLVWICLYVGLRFYSFFEHVSLFTDKYIGYVDIIFGIISGLEIVQVAAIKIANKAVRIPTAFIYGIMTAGAILLLPFVLVPLYFLYVVIGGKIVV